MAAAISVNLSRGNDRLTKNEGRLTAARRIRFCTV
jgi:hypothetical protein